MSRCNKECYPSSNIGGAEVTFHRLDFPLKRVILVEESKVNRKNSKDLFGWRWIEMKSKRIKNLFFYLILNKMDLISLKIYLTKITRLYKKVVYRRT